MQFCDECGSLMHTEGDAWVCRSCENEVPRDSQAESAMTTQDGQRDDGAPEVADATQDKIETLEVMDELTSESELTESDVQEIAQKINERGRKRVDEESA